MCIVTFYICMRVNRSPMCYLFAYIIIYILFLLYVIAPFVEKHTSDRGLFHNTKVYEYTIHIYEYTNECQRDPNRGTNVKEIMRRIDKRKSYIEVSKTICKSKVKGM